MLGGPWLGVIAFLVVAVALGWGLTKVFQAMLDQTALTLEAETLDHGFDPDATYITRKDLLLGVNSDSSVVMLVPGRDDLPNSAPGRRRWPTTAQYKDDPDTYKAYMIGIVEQGTRVQFVEVIDDPTNMQSRITVMTRVLDGPHQNTQTYTGVHLESADTDGEGGYERCEPRADLFELVPPEPGPVQSPAPDGP